MKSAVLYEGVRDVLTATASPTTLPAGQAVTSGHRRARSHRPRDLPQAPKRVGRRLSPSSPRGHLLPGSVYSIVHQIYVPGPKVYRIEIPGGPDNGRAVSQPFTTR